MDAAGVDELLSTLGAGDALQAKLNAELEKQGLSASTGLSPVDATAASSTVSSGSKPVRDVGGSAHLADIISGGLTSLVLMATTAQ